MYTKLVREKLDESGFDKNENILNEYNYVEGWTDLGVKSLENMQNEVGAAFINAIILLQQKSTLDMLMYYDEQYSDYKLLYK